jgi:hypothetical protein
MRINHHVQAFQSLVSVFIVGGVAYAVILLLTLAFITIFTEPDPKWVASRDEVLKLVNATKSDPPLKWNYRNEYDLYEADFNGKRYMIGGGYIGRWNTRTQKWERVISFNSWGYSQTLKMVGR